MTKTCTKCKVEKSVSEFHKHSGTKDGLSGWCKECRKEAHRKDYIKHKTRYQKQRKEYYQKNKKRFAKKWLLDKYNIDEKQLDIALDKRKDGVCAICGKPAEESKNSTGDGFALKVDHNHETGEVRGLLCTQCNLGLGFFNDSIENLILAIGYLDNPPGVN